MYKILANTIFIGKDVHYLPDCHSTNDIALKMVRSGQATEGSIVITDNQTKGKGQRGNIWLSKTGENLTFSLVFRPDFMDISDQFHLNMAVSNSIRKVLQDYIPTVKVKWPNDLIAPDFGKIGGILIENTFSGKEWEYAIVGIGLNINQVVFESPNATSIQAIAGSKFELEELFRLLITQLEQGYIRLKKGRWKENKAEYLMHLYRIDSWANYSSGDKHFSGKIVGISGDGRLLIELENGEIKGFANKEVSFL